MQNLILPSQIVRTKKVLPLNQVLSNLKMLPCYQHLMRRVLHLVNLNLAPRKIMITISNLQTELWNQLKPMSRFQAITELKRMTFSRRLLRHTLKTEETPSNKRLSSSSFQRKRLKEQPKLLSRLLISWKKSRFLTTSPRTLRKPGTTSTKTKRAGSDTRNHSNSSDICLEN